MRLTVGSVHQSSTVFQGTVSSLRTLGRRSVSCFEALSEDADLWRAQVRAQAVKQVLLGYLRVPESPDAPLDVVLNPGGDERRAERRVWNNGDGRIKLARLAPSALALWFGIPAPDRP